MSAEPVSLLELNTRIREGVRQLFPRAVWVVAEVGEMNVNYSGHCYMELVQKDRGSEQILARAKATIWANTFRKLKPFFETTTGQRWEAGINLMIEVTAEFHEAYGFSLNVRDVNPTYTVGELALQRRATLKALEEAGVLDMNRELELPFPAQRMAVISSDTAAGYGDFMDHLHNNPFGIHFYTRLFPAVMQGVGAEASIVGALQTIFNHESCFDAVALIRGGGAKADLHCFDGRDLAFHIAQFPLPVLTGIGHDRDESVADLVAWRAFKTPTAVADFLLEQGKEALDQTDFLARRLQTLTQTLFARQKTESQKLLLDFTRVSHNALSEKSKQMNTLGFRYKSATRRQLGQAGESLRLCRYRLAKSAAAVTGGAKTKLSGLPMLAEKGVRKEFQTEKKRLDQMEMQNRQLNPTRILSRGYVMATLNGFAVKSVHDLAPGREMTLYLADGKARAITREIYPSDDAGQDPGLTPD